MGQEEVQAAVYRLVSNFAREGRTNRLILLHGPNGSAKSTFVACMQRAMEHYSTLDEGALYKFNWIFPSQKLTKGGIGFGGGTRARRRAGDVRVPRRRADRVEDLDEMRDHPLLLLPRAQAARADRPAAGRGRSATASARPTTCCAAICRTATGRSSRRCCRRTTAISRKVLRHVQVERFFVSRRYRQAAATVEPQLAVDARSRQLTMDRSLGVAAAGAAVADALRVPGRAGRREPRRHRLRRSAQAAARVVQVPARHGRAGAACRWTSPAWSWTRSSSARRTRATWRRSRRSPSSSRSRGGWSWCACRTCSTTASSRRSTRRRSRSRTPSRASTSRRTSPG